MAKTSDEFNITFEISLCSQINYKGDTGSGCVSGTSVCMTFDNGTSMSAGNFLSERDELPGQHNEEIGESWMAFPGDKCLYDPSYNATTVINFKCGLTRVQRLSFYKSLLNLELD